MALLSFYHKIHKFFAFFGVILLISTFQSPVTLAMEEEEISHRALPNMKFKLGFEFQEGSRLCRWALGDCRIQKKPLFELNEKVDNRLIPLWHVVLDTDDIEFVTKPFTESLSLETCIFTIVESFESLRGLLKAKGKASFEEWTKQINNILKKDLFELTYSNHFNSIKYKLIIEPKNWNPRFSPQATVQHPLEYTIPLYFGLLGFKNPDHMMPFVASLPFRDLFLQCYENADSTKLGSFFQQCGKKISGLIFLHALTFVQMTPDEKEDNRSFLKETLEMFTNFQQVDAKMRLTLMSRRPFSSMFKDINLPTPDYSGPFELAMMVYNQSFRDFYKTPSLFHKANYAEQFFDAEGKEKSLVDLLPLFQEKFVKKNKDTLHELLTKGIVSTAMLRNLKKNVGANKFLSSIKTPGEYFKKSIDSVAVPQKRYEIDADNSKVIKVVSTSDNLSPPWFLDLENSMGAMKGDLEKDYGEAIVEVRGIKYVGEWFLKKTKLGPEIKEAFLTKPEQNLTQQALILFEFLKNFGTLSDIEDIKLGITHAIFKN